MTGSSVTGIILLLQTCVFSQAGVGYLNEVKSEADFTFVANSGSLVPGVERTSKFIVPVRDNDPDLLPVLFQNVNKYVFHQEFLALEFKSKFPGLDGPGYSALCEVRVSRKYYACVIFRFKGAAPNYGFDIFTAGTPGELPRPEEAKWVYDHVSPRFTIGPIAYSPQRPPAIKDAETWVNPGFPISFAFGGGFAPYVPYTLAENYGRVRILNPTEFQAFNESGELSSQDMLVLDEAPGDIEGVMAGVITGSIQTELSHLSIRTGRRGTPNAYVKEARAAFTPFLGKLVRLSVGADRYEVKEATLAEAEAWWATHRPKPVVVPPVDEAYDKLDSAAEIPLVGSLALNSRYGGKGANFGRLWHLLPSANRAQGFVIPMHYYFDHIRATLVPARKNPAVRVTLEAYILELLQAPEFRGDSRIRFEELGKLRALFEEGSVSSGIVLKVSSRINEVFGRTDMLVRFRSSSNAEHLLEFNGAGIYSSTSVCAADDLDSDSDGPSRCDSSEPKERGIARGLKRVWGSLWSFRGFEEREYFQIPQTAVGMGILVSESFGDSEQANAVAFTGNPTSLTDKRYFINCQKGDVEVVLPPPGVESEQDLLEMKDGLVVGIVRVRPSSLVLPGEFVLSDAQLRDVGRVMALIEKGFPFDLGGHSPEEVLRDIEFKINAKGELIFKDVRLFVVLNSGPPAREYRVTIPENFTLCGSFVESRPAKNVLAGKLRAGLRAGVHSLRTDGTSTDQMFEWLETGARDPRIFPAGPGRWVAKLQDRPGLGTFWSFDLHQDFFHSGELIRLTLENLSLRNDAPAEVTLDPLAFTWNISPYLLNVRADYGDPPDIPRYEPFLPCDMTHLPLYKTNVQFPGGDTLRIRDRFQDLEEGTGPAEIVSAEVNLTSYGGESRTVTDYWSLVYTAGHHNDTPYPQYWILFDPPMSIAGVGTARGLQIIQGYKPPPPTVPPQAYLLGEDLSPIASLSILSLERLKGDVNPLLFRRGDVDFDGQIRITDAIITLRFLFQGGIPIPCFDAADIDDFGTLEITDPILLLDYLYLGGEPPLPPLGECGEDPTDDSLIGCAGPGCR